MTDQTLWVTKILNNIFRVSFLNTEDQMLFSSNVEAEIKDCRKIHS